MITMVADKNDIMLSLKAAIGAAREADTPVVLVLTPTVALLVEPEEDLRSLSNFLICSLLSGF